MARDLWKYDNYSHRVILRTGEERTARRNRREKTLKTNLLNRPRVIVFAVVITILVLLFIREAKSVLSSNPRFMVNDIIVENSSLFNKDEICELLQINDAKGLMSFSVNQIVKILKKDPDVERVAAEKVLPNTLKLNIAERAPLVGFDYSGKRYLANKDGIILLRDRPNLNTPRITGLTMEQPVPGESCVSKGLMHALCVIEEANTVGLNKFVDIIGIDMKNESNIIIQTSERIVIKIMLNDLQSRLEKLVAILGDVQKKGRIVQLIDLRFKDVYVE